MTHQRTTAACPRFWTALHIGGGIRLLHAFHSPAKVTNKIKRMGFVQVPTRYSLPKTKSRRAPQRPLAFGHSLPITVDARNAVRSRLKTQAFVITIYPSQSKHGNRQGFTNPSQCLQPDGRNVGMRTGSENGTKKNIIVARRDSHRRLFKRMTGTAVKHAGPKSMTRRRLMMHGGHPLGWPPKPIVDKRQSQIRQRTQRLYNVHRVPYHQRLRPQRPRPGSPCRPLSTSGRRNRHPTKTNFTHRYIVELKNFGSRRLSIGEPPKMSGVQHGIEKAIEIFGDDEKTLGFVHDLRRKALLRG